MTSRGRRGRYQTELKPIGDWLMDIMKDDAPAPSSPSPDLIERQLIETADLDHDDPTTCRTLKALAIKAAAALSRLRADNEKAKTILVEMDARDKRNGFLPIWWREKLDAVLAALGGQHGQ